MNKSMWFVCPVALLASLVLFGPATPVVAADGGDVPPPRLERLERRVNEIADRQEQMMHQLQMQMERQARIGPAGTENRRPQLAPGEAPLPPMQTPHAVKVAKCLRNLLRGLFVIWILCNVLLAIWIFTDIRKRSEGSGIFVALALVAGIPAAIIYSLIRIGDRKA